MAVLAVTLALTGCSEEVIVSSLEVSTLPKTEYYVNETIQVEGGKLTINYSNGASETIDLKADMLKLDTVDMSAPGEKQITVTYSYNGKNYTTTFKITVSLTPEMLLAQAKEAALSELDEAYAAYDEDDYSTTNWELLTEAYTQGKALIEDAETISQVNTAKENALAQMEEVVTLEGQLANFELLKQAGIAQINRYNLDKYNDTNRATMQSKISAYQTAINNFSANHENVEQKTEELEEYIESAIEDLDSVPITYEWVVPKDGSGGTWKDYYDNPLPASNDPDDMPDGVNATVYTLTKGDGDYIRFGWFEYNAGGVDISDYVNDKLPSNQRKVALTYWLYINDVDLLKAPGTSVDNYAHNPIAVTNSAKSTSSNRGLYIDAKWYKSGFYNGLVSGWNRISIVITSSDSTPGIFKYVMVYFWHPALANSYWDDSKAVIKICDLKFEYLDAAQSGDVKVVEAQPDISSIEVVKLPDKLTYEKGENSIDVTDGQITVTYSDGTTEVVDMTADMVSLPSDMQTGGYRDVTVTYTRKNVTKTTTYTITVEMDYEEHIQYLKDLLNDEYEKYDEEDYSAQKWSELTGYYDDAMAVFNTTGVSIIDAQAAYNQCRVDMAAVIKYSEQVEELQRKTQEAIEKINDFDELSADDYEELLSKATTYTNYIEGFQFNRDNFETKYAELTEYIEDALDDIKSLIKSKPAVPYDGSNGKWKDSQGELQLSTNPDDMPPGVNAPVVTMGKSSGSALRFACFEYDEGHSVDISDYVNDKIPTETAAKKVAFTFWLYINDINYIKSPTVGDSMYLELGASNTLGSLSTTRGFFLDAKWYKTQFYNGLVSGWNKVSVCVTSSDSVPGRFRYIQFALYRPAAHQNWSEDAVLKICNVRFEYLDAAQTTGVVIKEAYPDAGTTSASLSGFDGTGYGGESIEMYCILPGSSSEDTKRRLA